MPLPNDSFEKRSPKDMTFELWIDLIGDLFNVRFASAIPLVLFSFSAYSTLCFRTLNALYISPGIPVIYYSMLYYVEFLLTISACMNLPLYRISTVRRMLDYI